MRAMLLEKPQKPLVLKDIPIPKPGKNQVLIEVEACAVCRTDLHLYEGELIAPKLPLILGHQVVGRVVQRSQEAFRFPLGTRVGIPWLNHTCGSCLYCLEGKENLCERIELTGFTVNGGFAEYCTGYEDYAYEIPSFFTPYEAAPLLCGGLIGFRALRRLQEAKKIGFYGFGSSAHILLQLCRSLDKEVFVFTRPGDLSAQEKAKELGACFAGPSNKPSPILLDGAIIFAPVGELIPIALESVKKGGAVISAGIYMSQIPAFSYDLLYGEKTLSSITNLTREDGKVFFQVINEPGRVKPVITHYSLEKANEALLDLKEGRITGSAVLTIKEGV